MLRTRVSRITSPDLLCCRVGTAFGCSARCLSVGTAEQALPSSRARAGGHGIASLLRACEGRNPLISWGCGREFTAESLYSNRRRARIRCIPPAGFSQVPVHLRGARHIGTRRHSAREVDGDHRQRAARRSQRIRRLLQPAPVGVDTGRPMAQPPVGGNRILRPVGADGGNRGDRPRSPAGPRRLAGGVRTERVA